MSKMAASASRATPDLLLSEVVQLYQNLHAGSATPHLPPPSTDGTQEPVFILQHVATILHSVLQSLRVGEVDQTGSVMEIIRRNVNALTLELLGAELNDDIRKITLCDLIEHLRALNRSVAHHDAGFCCIA